MTMPTEPTIPAHITQHFGEIAAENKHLRTVANHYEQTGRDLAALGYTVGLWTEDVRHADPCDCDLDEELVGDRCMDNSRSYWALMLDEGAHGWSMAIPLDRDVFEAIREWFEADSGTISERQKARQGLHDAWDNAVGREGLND